MTPMAQRAPLPALLLGWALRGLLAAALALPGSVRAAPAEPAAPTSVAAALEVGDLEAAQTLAVAARKAEPTPARWAEEAAVHERAGDLKRAIKAWKGHRDALPGDAEAERARADETIAALSERARGAVADEPASEHREALDQARVARLEALRPKPPPPSEPAPPPAPPRERVVTKWYFWVTVAAIAASAAAITGIAIQAAREEQADDLSGAGGERGGVGAPPGGLQVRF